MRHGRSSLGCFVLFFALLLVAVAAETPTATLTFNFKTIKVAGAQSTAIYGVNNNGAMVGSYVDSGGVRHGFKRLSTGKVTRISALSG
jgi:hypothetical protein